MLTTLPTNKRVPQRVALVSIRSARPTFFDILRRHQISTSVLSQESGVVLGTVIAMLYGNRVSRGEAAKVLAKISEISGKCYSLTNVAIAVIE